MSQFILYLSLTFLFIGNGKISNANEIVQISNLYLKNLFEKYGNGTAIEKSGLRKLLVDLKLECNYEDNNNYNQTHAEGEHDHKDEHGHEHEHEHEHLNSSNDTIHQCLNTDKLYEKFNLNKTDVITRETFYLLTPALIMQIEANLCNSSVNHNHNHKANKTHDSVFNDFLHGIATISKEKWIYSLVTVLIISVVGFICVYSVSKINEKFPQFSSYLTPFLVALAVGTLSGDALMHLIPHAFLESNDEHDSHSHSHSDADSHAGHYKGALKGLAALIGLYVFFLGEKLMQIKRSNKEKKHEKQVMEKAESLLPKTNRNANEETNNHGCEESDEPKPQMPFLLHCNKDLKYIQKILSKENEKENQDRCNVPSDANKLEISIKNTHGHNLIKHSAKMDHQRQHKEEIEDIKSNAWMAVMGDGLHNFSDGLAIGAAFATGLTTGITTAIAVFCHELPHEIGNFAVLRKAGMKIKRALIFNIVSSFLCFIGVVLGLIIGRFEFLSGWILLFISGTFLYISLVDMIPELAGEEDNLKNFFIQSGGILVGAGIMLAIALYEHRIASALN